MNASRSIWKGLLIKKKISSKLSNPPNKIPIKIVSRSSTITPKCLGGRFLIHNGKLFLPLEVNVSMIGHKFGEFAFTRQKFKFNK